MKSILSLTLVAFAVVTAGCASKSISSLPTSYFVDVHEFGPGKVDAAAVAKAHQADLAVQDKHGVRFVDYWLDEEHGRVYCLSEAKNAPSVVDTHREAHGLLPARILPVSSGKAESHHPGTQLYLDVHELGAGNVTAEAVAGAHLKDLATESQYGVRFLNYWVDETNGKVLCLSEAPNANAIRETHQHAHGLLPTEIVKVTAAE